MLQNPAGMFRHAVRLCHLPSHGIGAGTKPALAVAAAVLAGVALPAALGDEDGEVVIPNIVPVVTSYFATGQITEAEWETAIRYMIDEEIIRLGKPDLTNPELVAGTVTRNVDGNTIDIDDMRIRIPLVDVEDSGNATKPHAALARLLCPVGSAAQYDIDDLQMKDRYERTIAMVYCDTGISLGEVMIEFGLGWINEWYCDKSEFERAEWTEGTCWQG